VPFNSHNNYVDLVLQSGFAGLAAFLLLLSELGRLGFSLLDRVPAGFPRAYGIAALGGLAGKVVSCFLGDWAIPFVYNVGFDGFRASDLGWIFFGDLVAPEQMSFAGGKS
jgi:hypothetical protein